MSSIFQGAKLTAPSEHLTVPLAGLDYCRRVYEDNRHRVYALAFWMTDNELIAEQLMTNTFQKVFALEIDDPEQIDRALLVELQELIAFAPPSLRCQPSTRVSEARKNVRRVDLERAVVQLPPTERLVFLMHDVEAYDHDRIGRLLGLSVEGSQSALHQARLRIRELLGRRHS